MRIFFLLIFFLPLEIFAEEYIYEVGGTNTSADENTIEYPDGSKFIVYHGEYAAWKDNKGDYGREKCIGYVLVNKDKSADVHFRCIASNQDGETFWTIRNRKSAVEEGGGGINTYTAGTGKYKKMVGIKCPYGVQYHKDIVWYTHKCKLN